MTTLWLAIANADEATRSRAVDALHDAGLTVSRTVQGQEPPAAELTRDPVVATLGGGFLVLFGGAAVWMLVLGGWWIAGAVPCALGALFGATGLAYGLQRTDRTRKTTKKETA